ncbi:hypothetical protein VIMS_02854 [Mycobacterium marinum]|nr:hypothetical protein VIMS_02854 [Mycobacterium marinum]
MPVNGSLGLFAERKAGKTTMVVDMVRTALSGELFLGRFGTHLPDGARVTLVDTEMSVDMLDYEYTKVGVPADDLERIDLHPLRGRSRLLDLRNEATRARWKELIAPRSMIVVDCLYNVLAAAQIDDSSAQVADIIDGFKALAVECDAVALVIVHRLGKDPDKGARGHSSIEGSVDTLATIRLEGPSAADLFSATGRLDVNVPSARLMRGTPAELARRLDPKFVVTPTIRLLSDIAVRSVTEPDQRDIVTTPPRTGKSRLLAIWEVVWALMRDPDLQIVLVSCSDELAQAHSREARQLINEHADYLGYRLSADKTAVGRWRVDGHQGGLLATGINSGVTGFGADLLIVDDPVKDADEADSAAHRRRVIAEYRSTLATRVHSRRLGAAGDDEMARTRPRR